MLRIALPVCLPLAVATSTSQALSLIFMPRFDNRVVGLISQSLLADLQPAFEWLEARPLSSTVLDALSRALALG